MGILLAWKVVSISEPRPDATQATAAAPADAPIAVAPRASTAPAPALDAPSPSYSTIEELRDAYVEAGGPCDDWKIHPAGPQPDKYSYECDFQSLLILFKGPETNPRQVATRIAEVNAASGISGTLLVGDNWIISSPYVTFVATVLPGTLLTYPE